MSEWTRNHAIRDAKDCWVYVIAAVSDDRHVVGPVKVGITADVPKRLSGLQTGSPLKLVIVGKYAFWRREHARLVEGAFHRACDVHRLEGEWFDIMPDAAVAIMAVNIKAFVDRVLQPEETTQYFSAMSYIGLPGFDYDLDGLEFKY